MKHACIDCGAPFTPAKRDQARCPRHQATHDQARYQRRPRGNQPHIRATVLRRDRFTCQACGHHDPTGQTLRADHIHAHADGGPPDTDNSRTLCARCHDDRSAEQRRRRGATGWQKPTAPPAAASRPAGLPPGGEGHEVVRTIC